MKEMSKICMLHISAIELTSLIQSDEEAEPRQVMMFV